MRLPTFLSRTVSTTSVESRKSASEAVARLASKASERSVSRQQPSAKSDYGKTIALVLSTVIAGSSIRLYYDRMEQWKDVNERYQNMQREHDSALANIVKTRSKLEESVTEGVKAVTSAPRAERVQRLRDWIDSKFEIFEDTDDVEDLQIADGTGTSSMKDVTST